MEAGEILEQTGATRGSLMPKLRDKQGRYLVPRLAGTPGTTPNVDLSGQGLVCATLDTGVWTEHPAIKDRLNGDPLDVTGEGPIDETGHGTMVALLLLNWAPSVGLVSIKVLNREGQGSLKWLLKGLEVAAEKGVDLINLSLGRYDPSCRGDCVVCSAVANLAAMGIVVVAAAGNEPGRTDCPAKAGLFKDKAFAVGAFDLEAQSVAWYSSPGSVLGPVGRYELVPYQSAV